MEMPKIYVNPPRSEWPALTARCTRQEEEIGERVAAILAEVRTGGDAALRRIVRRIEGYLPETFEVTRERRAEAAKAVSPQLKAALAQAKANIEAFHRAQLPAQVEVETMPGVRCVQRAVAIGRAGLYIPGGKAPLFSTVLMLALPARIAGCREVILCTPCGRDGRIAPEILYAADLCGVDRVFALGGAQAVATATSPKPNSWPAQPTSPWTCPRGLRRCWCWPTKTPGPNSPPPTCCRRPNTVMTVRPCWSAAARSSHSGQ